MCGLGGGDTLAGYYEPSDLMQTIDPMPIIDLMPTTATTIKRTDPVRPVSMVQNNEGIV
jgi:hypothetical protein